MGLREIESKIVLKFCPEKSVIEVFYPKLVMFMLTWKMFRGHKNEFRVHNPCIHECKDVYICLHGGCKAFVCEHTFHGHKLVSWWAQGNGCCA